MAAAPLLVLFAGTAASVRAGAAAAAAPAAGVLAASLLLLWADRGLRGTEAVGGERRAGPGAERLGPPGRGAGLNTEAVLRALFAAGTVAAVTVLAVAGAPLLPGLPQRPPWDPRTLVHQPRVALDVVDPLGQAAAWLAAPPRPLFTVDTTTPVNLRWLVLDRYDGASWTSSADYQAAGRRLPDPPGGAGRVRDVTVTVHAGAALPGSWLPSPDRPVEVDGMPVSADTALEALATGGGQAAAGADYTVHAAVPAPDLAEVQTAVPAQGADAAADIALPPGLPDAVAALGDQLTAQAAYPYQQMAVVEQRLRALYTYDPAAAPADAYGNLALFVTSTRRGGPDVFATLFAVLARHAGFPARLVVGFGPGHLVAAHTYQVTTADVQVWPEVEFQGIGWVAFAPQPSARATGEAAVPRTTASPSPQPSRSALDQAAASAGPAPAGPRPTPRIDTAATGSAPGGSPPLWSVAGAGAAAAVAAYLAAAWAARRRARTLRRRAPDPRRRTIGAWRDALNSLHLAGAGPTASLTSAEVAARAAAVLGPGASTPASALAVVAERALFSPQPPTPDDAATAWASADDLRARSRRRAGMRARWRALWRWEAGPGRPGTGAGR